MTPQPASASPSWVHALLDPQEAGGGLLHAEAQLVEVLGRRSPRG